MLRFFREYNKYILVVGVGFLMVAFLIQPTLSMFVPDPTGEVIGTIGDDQITLGEQRRAGTDLWVLNELAPILADLGGSKPGAAPDSFGWLLMLHDARSMGLWASGTQVDEMLGTIGLDEDRLAGLARRLGVSANVVEQALRNWITIQAYKELVLGVVHDPGRQRLQHYLEAGQYLQFGRYQDAVLAIGSAYQGRARLSGPLVERFLQDHQTTVKAAVLAIPSDRYLPQVSEPDEQALVDQFERYKDVLAGQSGPYGFGYRIPDRVKLEYLSVPFDRVRQQVRVEEADLLSYYDAHRDEFQIDQSSGDGATGDAEKSVLPYEKVRNKIRGRLIAERASELGDRVIKFAQAMLLEDARSLEQRNGYREVPAGWTPMALEQVAVKVQQQFGILPDVHRHDDGWLTRVLLQGLAGIGSSYVASHQPRVGFVPYAFSAKRFAGPAVDASMGSLKLQAQLPSTPLVAPDGGRYLFRLLDAQPSRVPASVDAVRELVRRDVKQLAAYNLLKSERVVWLSRAREKGLVDLAAQLGLEVVKSKPFSKRRVGVDGRQDVADVAGVGRSEAFVDSVFELAYEVVVVAQAGRQGAIDYTAAIDQVPPAVRTAAIGVDEQMSVVLVRLDDIEPMTRGDFERVAGQRQVGAWIKHALFTQQDEDPLSLDALIERVHYVSARAGDESDDEVSPEP